MKTILLIIGQLLVIFAQSQVKISGVIKLKDGKPVSGANLFLQGTYDGCTSDSLGQFQFKTEETGKQMLVASFVGYQTNGISLDIKDSDITGLSIVLKEEASELDEVVINAGSFEASDKKKSVLLKPMDIALTAGANGDIYGAFGTLPGSHLVGEEGRLFVRGGESYETKTFMDGMLVNSPYYSKTPDLPTRGRFSPLLFNGMVFSTGGYSAEYGQALSSIVDLNTTALEPKNQSNISVMTVGIQGSHARRWENTSLAFTGELLHTGLSNKIFKQNIDWEKDPVITGSTLLFRHKTSETGMIKTFGSFNLNSSSMIFNNQTESAFQKITLFNINSYVNTTFNEMLNKKWMINSGIAINSDREKINIDEQQILTNRKNVQLKVNFTNFTSEKITTKVGADYISYDYSQNIIFGGDYLLNFTNQQFSGFAESELKVNSKLAFKAGIRVEHSTVLHKTTVMPRLSAAVKTSKNSQVSMAFGDFYQNPEDDYLKFSSVLAPEKSIHSILTYQYKKNTYSFRVEAYNKKYTNLVKFDNKYSFEPGNFSNSGTGYSRGIDVFWRDQKPFGKSDYWISYSWNNSKRNYRDFPVEATPHYVSAHNLSVVYKKFFMPINCFVSATYSFASGRKYYNPNNPVFMADKTKPYNDVSLGLTHILYLFNKQTVLHVNVNNVLGFNNIYGYNYNSRPNQSGIYDRATITPASKRMVVALISFQL